MPNRIAPGAPKPVTTSTPASAPAPTAKPAEPSKANGWAPGAEKPRASGATNPLVLGGAELLGKAAANAGPSSFTLVPGRYPTAVGLPDVLAKLGNSPEGQQMVDKLLGQLTERTGVPVAPEMRDAILKNPQLITRAFELSPEALRNGMVAVNAAYQAGKIPQTSPRTKLLPQTFDFAKLGALEVPRGGGDLKQIAPGLFKGSLPSDTSDAQVKTNRVVAEVFHRLSNNATAPANERFSVKYGGGEYTRLDTFLGALQKDGYQVNVSFEQRIANFADLKAAVPGTNPPQFVDVPAPLMVKTGITDALGKEALVPAAHAEMIVTLSSSPETKGPKLDSRSKFYQGTGGTGFFACDVSAEPAWLGRVQHGEVTGDAAVRAVKLAGLLGDVINDSAKALNLYADGYGVTGVCNDSVAVIEQAMLGAAHEYPLMMQDAVLQAELQKRLGDGVRRDDPDYRVLSENIARLPTDTSPNASLRERALASIPWSPGKEPFVSTEQARKILAG